MEEKLTKIRSEEVRVKFQPDMKKRVDRIAAMHGTPTATWCHQVIAKAVVDLERQYQLQNKTAEHMVKAMQEFLQPMLEQAIQDQKAIEAQEQEEGQKPSGE